MKRIATFEKVDKNVFIVNVTQTIGKELESDGLNSNIFGQALKSVILESVDVAHKILVGIWDDVINIPKRKTKGSAGYDFGCPFDICLLPGQEVVIPTGIKCRMDDGWVLKVYPRSGLGFKYRCRLANTVGVIDSDYYNNPDNEGHILIKIVNEGNKKMELHAGDSFAQGIFSEFGITTDDDVEDSRVGGIGSTGR